MAAVLEAVWGAVRGWFDWSPREVPGNEAQPTTAALAPATTASTDDVAKTGGLNVGQRAKVQPDAKPVPDRLKVDGPAPDGLKVAQWPPRKRPNEKARELPPKRRRSVSAKLSQAQKEEHVPRPSAVLPEAVRAAVRARVDIVKWLPVASGLSAREWTRTVPFSVGLRLSHALAWRERGYRLTRPDREYIHALLPNNASPTEEILGYCPSWEPGKYAVTREDMGAVLATTGWFPGNVVNYYLKLIERRSREQDRPTFPTVKSLTWQFYTKLMQFVTDVCPSLQDDPDRYCYQAVRRWFRKMDLFSFDYVLIPLNRSRNHWTLACYDVARHTLTYYDSMGGAGTAVLKNLKRWLEDEHLARKSRPLEPELTLSSPGRSIPQQGNGYDCGVYCTQFANSVAVGHFPFRFNAADMTRMRAMMCIELVEQRVPCPP